MPPAAHAQAVGGLPRSEGEFKETGATRLRLPRPGRGYRHHAGDSGAPYSGGSESGGGETCPGGRQAGHVAEVSRSWAQPCFNSADPGPRPLYPQTPNTNRSTPRTPLPQLRESPLQPAVAGELSPLPHSDLLLTVSYSGYFLLSTNQGHFTYFMSPNTQTSLRSKYAAPAAHSSIVGAECIRMEVETRRKRKWYWRVKLLTALGRCSAIGHLKHSVIREVQFE